MSTVKIPGKCVRQIESIVQSQGPRLIYSSMGEIGLLSFSETSKQLIPHARISISGMRTSASLLSYVTAENLLVILAAEDGGTIYQIIYDPMKRSLSHAPSVVSNEQMSFNSPPHKPLAIHKQDDNSVTVVGLKQFDGDCRLPKLVF